MPVNKNSPVDPSELMFYWPYLFLLCLLLVGFYFFCRYRMVPHQPPPKETERKKTAHAAEMLEKKENAEKRTRIAEQRNRDITDSIRYAQRLQAAIQPPDQLFRKVLPDSFVVYIPKDIVAGDFYWLHYLPRPRGWNVDGDRVLFAVGDCTGHGVPGALVSMVCNDALRRAVQEFACTSPADILNKACKLIIGSFKPDDEEVYDGMDISLCALNTTTLKLEWAGAFNPLYIIRENGGPDLHPNLHKEKENSRLEEIKADRRSVGLDGINLPFTNHHIQLQQGDMLYLFSDGYPDQFGGPKGKKFRTKQFKELLLRLHRLPVKKQKACLLDAFVHWKGNLEQVDDVCVMGIRITQKKSA